MEIHKNHQNYSYEIDGLRALAVLSVVIFHTFPNALTGGFIGVDVFFCHKWVFDNPQYI